MKKFPILTSAASTGLICLLIGYLAAAFVQGGWPDLFGRLAAVIFALFGFILTAIWVS